MIKERIKQLRKLMKQHQIDVYYVPSDDDHMSEYVASHFQSRKFISGFTGSAGVFAITQKEAGLWTDGRYFVQAENELKNTGVTLYKMRQKGVIDVETFIEKALPKEGVLGFDGRVVNERMKEKLQQHIKSQNGRIVLQHDLVGEIWEDRPPMPLDSAYFLPNKYTGESTLKKITRVKNEMKLNNVDALIISSLEDVCWLFNMRGSDVLNTPLAYSYALIDKEQVILYIDERKLTKELVKECTKNKVVIKPYKAIEEDLRLLNSRHVWLEKECLNALLFAQINATNTILDKPICIKLMRAIKNKVQIQNLRNAHIKDGVAMCQFIYYIKNELNNELMTELSVTKKLQQLREAQKDFVTISFSTIAAYGANAAMMHYSASEKSNATLKPEGFLLVDSGGTYLDGTTDITRTIPLGSLSDHDKKMYTLVLKGMLGLMRAKFLYGTTGQNLDILARGPLWQEAIDYQCGTGHGVGYVMSVHEGPQSIRWGHNPNAVALEEGMVVTDEPGVYIPNELGIRIENELLVQKAESNTYGQFLNFETITYCPIDTSAIDLNYLTQQDIDDLNKYHEMVYQKISPYLNKKEKTWLKLETRKIRKKGVKNDN